MTLSYEELAQKATNYVIAHMRKPRGDGRTGADHCIDVARLVANAGYSPNVIIAALLHDILEDTDTTYSFLTKEYGYEIAATVLKLTRNGSDAKSTRNYLHQIESSGIHVVAIKIADNTCNLPTHPNPARYAKYAQKIQDIGARVLGEEHPLVLQHLRVLRSVKAQLVNAPG